MHLSNVSLMCICSFRMLTQRSEAMWIRLSFPRIQLNFEILKQTSAITLKRQAIPIAFPRFKLIITQQTVLYITRAIFTCAQIEVFTDSFAVENWIYLPLEIFSVTHNYYFLDIRIEIRNGGFNVLWRLAEDTSTYAVRALNSLAPGKNWPHEKELWSNSENPNKQMK